MIYLNMAYNSKKIEKKWQQKWQEQAADKVSENKKIPKEKRRYILDMFPYPSGAGLHVGHPEGYTATDIYSRYLRMKGFTVLHPMGWDAFGLPAENYAIKKGAHPKESTLNNIKNFKRQIKSLGFSYDWSREIATCDPDYYKWTQWFFLLLYKNNLAYQAKAPVNWCKSCKTVLAREQVIEGKCERCGNQVIQKKLKQWFFKITNYADRLLSDLDKIDWPEPIKLMQKNWIGKSNGALIKFKITDQDQFLEIFTTRADTVFGATYMVLAPEHQLVTDLKSKIKNYQEIKKYLQKSKQKSELERTDLAKEKIGIELKGVKAINPATGEKIPIWVADYVLTSYGTGAIMAVPAHDKRDFEFAKKYNLPIKFVIKPQSKSSFDQKSAYTGAGILMNSQSKKKDNVKISFNGISSKLAQKKIVDWLSEKNLARKSVQYKLRDWLISRQRYWGAPIPIIYCPKCGKVPVPEKNLPVKLPADVDFKPHGKSPLEESKSFHNIKCPKCGVSAKRESDTMDTFVCSSWYQYRYTDSKNDKEFASKEKIEYWMPVDVYVGGAEHAVMHLLYARFICKVLYDKDYINFQEPFKKLINQGLIMAEDGRKMSKSLGNVVNPDKVVAEYGADTLRMYEMFLGPLEASKPWSTQSIKGIRRFLEKVYDLAVKENFNHHSKIEKKFQQLLHQTIKKVSNDIEDFKFNTAISQLMILVNAMQKQKQVSISNFKSFLKLLAPFAPHLAEELWEKIGQKNSVLAQEWPVYNQSLVRQEKITIPVQINGKVRDEIEITKDLSKKAILELAKSRKKVIKQIKDKKIKKEIYIPGRIVSFVV